MTTEYEHFIEITPPGEDVLHERGFGCECGPEVTLPHRDAKPVLTHQPLKRKEQRLKRAA